MGLRFCDEEGAWELESDCVSDCDCDFVGDWLGVCVFVCVREGLCD